jgi:aspartate carbamoyltransferase regulatory subunit
LNVIKGYKVIKKERLTFPDHAEGIIECINPNCITNIEKIPTKFSLKKNPLRATCYYCETTMEEEEIMKGIK